MSLVRSGKKQKIQVAEETPFDNTGTDFVSNNVQNVIEEIGTSASPGYSFGRAGNNNPGTYLNRPGGVPSNTTGITVGFSNPILRKVVVATENLDTYTLNIYEHEGNSINLTLLTTVSVTLSRSETFNVDVTVTQGRQLAVQIASGSARNIGVDLNLIGSF